MRWRIINIIILNGSPKGKYSITLQTALYIQKHFPADCFDILHVGQQIKQFEKNMGPAVQKIQAADLVLFCYPVYTFIAPSQLHRFIELLKEYPVDLNGKFVAQITTSKHFYDYTAHRYIEENCADRGMKIIRGLSADMDDLLTEQGQKDALKYWEYVRFCCKSDRCEPVKPFHPSGESVPGFKRHSPECLQNGSEPDRKPYLSTLPVVEKSDQFDTVIVTNCESHDTNLQNMISDFRNIYPFKTRVVNIREYPFSGGCLGCFNCAFSGKCIYKDGFDVFLREEIQRGAAIVYAFTIKDHSMGASFKQYDDRQFCNGHRTVTMGMPMGYIVSGLYSREHNLRDIIEGRCEVGHNFLCGVATDEQDTAKALKVLSDKLAYALEKQLVLHQNFLGVGGMKIFRDLIYVMRGLMKEDHRFYKKHGIYDFPQKKIGTILKMKLVGTLIAMPSVRSKMGNKMNDAMIEPYRKVINRET